MPPVHFLSVPASTSANSWSNIFPIIGPGFTPELGHDIMAVDEEVMDSKWLLLYLHQTLFIELQPPGSLERAAT